MSEQPAESRSQAEPQEEYRYRRRRRREQRPWIWGLILVILGLAFLAENISGTSLVNWWALFILLPAFAALARAWQAWSATGAFTAQVAGNVIAGLALVLVTIVFLLGLDWGTIWPIFLILAGLGALLAGLSHR